MMIMMMMQTKTSTRISVFRIASHIPVRRRMGEAVAAVPSALSNRHHRLLSSSSSSSTSSSVPGTALKQQQQDNTTPTTHPLIDFFVASKIEGEESQIVTVQLQPGETLRAESASMLYMTEGIEMDTTLGSDAIGGAFRRFLTGQNIFLTDFTYKGTSGSGTVALGTDFPSKILRIHLPDVPDNTLICQKGAYLASNPDTKIEMEFAKSMTAGFFGGQGFVLQKLSGQGDVLVKGGGTIVVQDLAPGEVLRVSPGSIVAFESTVQYDTSTLPGIKNAIFGEGLFVAILTGPGRIWLQGMPPNRMIAEIARRVPSGGGIGLGVPIAGGGGGGEGEAAGGAEGTEGVASGAVPVGGDASVSGEDAVAAADASVEADRASTVVTSDADSSSALFGDAAPEGSSTATSGTPEPNDSSDFSLQETMSSNEPQFKDEDFTTQEPSFDEQQEEFSDFANEEFKDGELFDDDTTTTEGLDSAPDEDSGSGLLGTLWDLFTGGDE